MRKEAEKDGRCTIPSETRLLIVPAYVACFCASRLRPASSISTQQGSSYARARRPPPGPGRHQTRSRSDTGGQMGPGNSDGAALQYPVPHSSWSSSICCNRTTAPLSQYVQHSPDRWFLSGCSMRVWTLDNFSFPILTQWVRDEQHPALLRFGPILLHQLKRPKQCSTSRSSVATSCGRRFSGSRGSRVKRWTLECR